MAKRTQERISQREYARRLGVSNEAVRKAIDSGKIVKGWDKKEQRIIFDIANKEWGALHFKNNINAIVNDEGDGGTVGKNLSLNGDSSFADARRVKEIIQAQLVALDLKERKGELVKKDQVYKELYAFGQQMRTSLQAVPDRVIDNILASKSRAEAHTLLTDAIHEVLEILTAGKEFNFKS